MKQYITKDYYEKLNLLEFKIPCLDYKLILTFPTEKEVQEPQVEKEKKVQAIDMPSNSFGLHTFPIAEDKHTPCTIKNTTRNLMSTKEVIIYQ